MTADGHLQPTRPRIQVLLQAFIPSSLNRVLRFGHETATRYGEKDRGLRRALSGLQHQRRQTVRLAAAIESVMPRSSLHLVPEAHGDASALREGRIDLDLGSLRGRDPEVLTLELSRQRLVVVMHPTRHRKAA